MPITQHPRPRYALAHLSDLHLTGDGAPLYGAVDAHARLASLLDRLVETGRRLDALVLSGDLADRGDASAYRSLKELIEPAAQAIGAQVIYAMGNHDERGAFAKELMGFESDGRPLDHVAWVGGLRVIVVDSSVPNSPFGEVDAEQRAWLASELTTPAPDGSVLVIHHPPAPTVQDMAVTCELIDQALLAEVVRGSDIRTILSGHVHYTSHSTFAGIPVSAVTSTACSQDLFEPGRGTRARDAAQGLSFVEFYDDLVLHYAAPLDTGANVGRHIPAREAAAILDAEGFVFPGR